MESFDTLTPYREGDVEQLQPSDSETVEIILQLEREIMEAIKLKDSVALGTHVADDFVHRAPGGVEAGKAEFLESTASLPVEVLEIWGEELNVTLFGDTAVLTGVQRVKVMNEDGKEEEGAGAFTDVFVKRDWRWVMVLAFSVDLPAPLEETTT